MNLTGSITLNSLYQFAKADVRDRKAGESALKGSSVAGREYANAVRAMCEPIAKQRGFYAFGYFERNGAWHTVYVGKAGFGKTASLQARISEELRDERVFVWSAFEEDERLLEVMRNLYGVNGRHKSRAGENHFRRALRKKKSTHILWVATPTLSDADVTVVEPDLIELLNPAENVQRSRPSASLQDDTVTVVRALKAEMHRNRPTDKYIQ